MNEPTAGAIAVHHYATAFVRTNRGTVTGGTNFFAGNQTNETIVNTGRMTGAVSFGPATISATGPRGVSPAACWRAPITTSQRVASTTTGSKAVPVSGADIFVYKVASDCRGIDVVSDFDDSGNDRIDLSGPFSGTLIYRGTGAFNGTHQVHIKDIAGPDVLVEINLSGSAAPEVRTHLAGSKTASDVIL